MDLLKVSWKSKLTGELCLLKVITKEVIGILLLFILMEVEIKTGPIITPEKLELVVDEKQKDIRSIVARIIPIPVESFGTLISDDLSKTETEINERGKIAMEVIKQIFQDTSLAQVWARNEERSINKLNIYFSSFRSVRSFL